MSSNSLPADPAPFPAAEIATAPMPAVEMTIETAALPPMPVETSLADATVLAAGAEGEGEAPDDATAPAADADSTDATGESAESPARVGAIPVAAAPQLSPAETAALLKQLFPALFSGAAKPLKLRIQADIQERAPGRFSKQSLSGFFRRHTGSTSYLMALSRATQRFDLDGNPAGELSAEHRQLAADELTRRRSLNDSRRADDNKQRAEEGKQRAEEGKQQRAEEANRRAEEDAQRFNRATLLRAFETTTLTPANFCALKGIAIADFEVYIARARAEAAAAPPERRPEPRHDPRPDQRPERRLDERGARPDNRPAGRDARGGRGAPGAGRSRPAGGGGGAGGPGRR